MKKISRDERSILVDTEEDVKKKKKKSLDVQEKLIRERMLLHLTTLSRVLEQGKMGQLLSNQKL